MLPAETRNTLRYGEPMAAIVPAIRNSWRAWVYVRPELNDSRNGHGFPLPLNNDEDIQYTVRRVELSEWHLDEKWAWDLDVAIEQQPILDEVIKVQDDTSLEAVLRRWSCDPADLSAPNFTAYPYPPATENGCITKRST